jgi:Protein of unknown function (DUF2793)
MTASGRLSLPFLVPGQAQKEMFHNEALQQLDVLVQTVIEGSAVNVPPGNPVVGHIYLVGMAPSGIWQGQANALAAWTSNGWRFTPAFEGLHLIVRSSGQNAVFRAGGWLTGVLEATSVRVNGTRVLGPQTAAIPNPSAGAVQDVQARATLDAVLDSLRSHGIIAS